MTTPLGGTRAEAYWFDADGRPTDAARAVSGEIVEFDADDVELGRTYVEPPDPSVAITPAPDPGEGNDPENADALKKGTWDLRHVTPDGQWEHPVQTLDELLNALHVWGPEFTLTEKRDAVGSLMGLPAWEAAPAHLRALTNAWMVKTRQE